MKLESQSKWSYIDQTLNVKLRLSDYALKNGDSNIINVILDRVVDSVVKAFIEQHQEELLASIDTSSLGEKIQERISQELAKAAIAKLLEK
jgi:hypothetical protein